MIQSVEAVGAPIRGALTIELDADATIGYAAIQNDVPVVRGVRIANSGVQTLVGIDVLIRCEPAFARPVHLRFEALAPGEARRIAPVDLVPDHAFLADNVEALRGLITVAAVSGGVELATEARPIEVLAYDQWAGTRALPELIAAFSMPNDAAVDGLIGRASALLRGTHPDLSMDGYQSKNRDRVWKQISAIYSTIAAENLQYAEPPASFGTDGQKIRTPDRILEGRVATCLDLAMLFSSCLEQAGLRPLILIRDGHAWCGAWLHEAAFPTALVDDVQSIRKRVDGGELIVFETTGVAQHASLRPSLRGALDAGMRHLHDAAAFRFAVDIQRARQQKIRPLPSRATGIKRGGVAVVDEPVGIEPTPVLPPLDPMAMPALAVAAPDTPAGRLAVWKAKLLDLTLRNRLLNFRPTKASLRVLTTDLASLEDALFEGKEFRVREKPTMMTGADPRDADVHAGRHGVDPVIDHARERLSKGEIVCDATAEALDGHLLALYRDAKTSLEEGGSNTLYIALGFLRWVESAHAETPHMAPLLLVPITLQRASVRSGFRLSRHDDETIVNPTLLEMLRQNHGMTIAGLDPLPMDEKGVDVPRVLQLFRLAVAEIPQWEVLDHAYLGIFSFTKYLMWKDLNDRSEQLRVNRVVRHLLENPGRQLGDVGDPTAGRRLDDTHGPADLLAPLLSDSSQLEAIRVVDAGHDLVLEGPPGTGKSQTITNLIAHLLAKSKSVLFVSEKITALEVVHRRLNDIGLGPFCLELHSAKAKKLEVVQQLGAALDARSNFDQQTWDRAATRLGSLRSQLNELVDALHHVHANGLTVRGAITTCALEAGRPVSPLAWTDVNAHDRGALDDMRENVRRIAALASEVGDLRDHPLAEIGQTEWTNGWQAQLEAAAQRTIAAASAMQSAAAGLGQLLPEVAHGGSLEVLAAVDAVADVLLQAPKLPSGLARRANDHAARTQLAAIAAHSNARNQHWGTLAGRWRDELASRDATEISRSWTEACGSWWPRSWFRRRDARASFARLRVDGALPTDAEIAAMLDALALVNTEDRALQQLGGAATELLGEAYNGLATDWGAVAQLDEWARCFTHALDRLEALDPVGMANVRQRLMPLVAEQRHLLAAGGALGTALVVFRQRWYESSTELRQVSELARVESSLAGPVGAGGALERIVATLSRWMGATRGLQPWCLWRAARAEAIARNLGSVVQYLENGSVPLREAPSLFERSYQDWWCKRMVDASPVLRTFSSADHERKIGEFRAADGGFQKLSEAYVTAQLCAKLPMVTDDVAAKDSELGTLQRERQKQKKHIAVRQLLASLPTMLPRLKPCLLMSPLSVAQYLAAGQTEFDVVVFDEASQIPVWDAIGVIARGKQVVVVGDPKQLPPTNFFVKSSGDDARGDEDTVEDLESILDECMAVGMRRLSLQWHYRSRHEGLIHFSNVTYYGSRLVTFPSVSTQDRSVRLERVDGPYDRGGSCTNRAEAEAVVRYIERHHEDEAKTGSIGVVTFNAAQQELIETLLDARRRANPALDQAIAAPKGEALFIKNLEAVQGDERDIILFSTTYGPDAAGKMTMNFGPINRDGGQRRLNVAVSRARVEVVVFSCLRPEHFSKAQVRAAGVRDLIAYLEFAERGPRALTEASAPTGQGADSPFETEVAAALRERGWEVHLQVGCSGYRIDMAIVDPRAPGRYMLGVECDGRAYHSGATARDRDRLRQLVLEGLGWRLHRIWSTDWWRDRGRVLERIDGVCKELLATEPAAATPAPAPIVAPVTSEAVAEDVTPRSVEPRSAQVVRPSEPVYTPHLLTRKNPDAFADPSSSMMIRAQLTEVIAKEGPVLDDVALRRVAESWGKQKLGKVIRSRIAECLPRDVVMTREGERTFYWPAGTAPREWRAYRVADESEGSRRSIDEVCTEEIQNIAASLLRQLGRCGAADLVRAIGRKLGIGRLTADVDAQLRAAVDALAVRGDASIADGYVTPIG